jgi:hypothetical protein
MRKFTSFHLFHSSETVFTHTAGKETDPLKKQQLFSEGLTEEEKEMRFNKTLRGCEQPHPSAFNYSPKGLRRKC